MAATARVIWLCACVRYWPDRGLVFECVTCFYRCYIFSYSKLALQITNGFVYLFMHKSILAVPFPPGNRGAFAHVVSPGGGAFAILSRPRGLGISVPRGDPRAFDTRVFECQRLTCPSETRKNLSMILKVCFPNFRYFFIICKRIDIGDKVNYILFIAKQSPT